MSDILYAVCYVYDEIVNLNIKKITLTSYQDKVISYNLNLIFSILHLQLYVD